MIRLNALYQGAPSHEQPIEPGDYADDDPRLFGIADYLVSNGFATRLDAPVVETEPVAAPKEDVQEKANLASEARHMSRKRK